MAGEPLGGFDFPIGDARVRENWDKQVFKQFAQDTVLFDPTNGLVGKKKAFIVRKKEPFTEGGTRVTMTLVHQLKGAPTHGNQTMEDREETPDSSFFQFETTKIRHAVRVDGEIFENRVTWNLIDTSSMLLGEWFATAQEAAGAMHLTGFNIDGGRTVTEPWWRGDDLASTWGNAPVAPDTTHEIRVNDKLPENYTSTDILDLGVFDKCIARAKTLPQKIRPLHIFGDHYYLALVHPYAVTHWRENGTRWWELAMAAIQGGMINGNPVIKGMVGVYNKIIFIETPYLPPAINSARTAVVDNSRYAVFGGQQALCLGLAKKYPTENTFRTVTRDKDYADKVGVEAHTIQGMAVPRFEIDGTTQRMSTIVLSGYAKDEITPA